MYKSPIDVMIADIQHQIAQQQDEDIYKAVVSVGINVDKDELIRALRYDRDQYSKGYAAGKRDAISDWVRCKDCTNFERKFPGYGYCYHWDCEPGMSPNEVEEDDFCSYGERRTDNGC